MIGEKLNWYLRTDQSICNALSQTPHGPAIFPGHKPQDAKLPTAQIRVTGGAPDYHLNGEIGDLAKLVEIDVHAANRKDANDIAELVHQALLSQFSGGTWDETVIKSVTIESDAVEIDENPTDGSDRWIYRTVTIYRITYVRSVG